MILYSATVKRFVDDVENIRIVNILNDLIYKNLYRRTTDSEQESWSNSLKYMSDIVKKASIADDCTIALEYNLSMTGKRIDFILTGYNSEKKESIILFELKQWSEVKSIAESNILLETFVGNSLKEVIHPAYQVWSYQELLNDFNNYIQVNDVKVNSCCVLHNYRKKDSDPLFEDKFSDFLSNVNVFTKDSEKELIDFININIKTGDNGQIIHRIDVSKISPSINLQNNISNLINNNSCFTLIDEQMIVYDKVINYAQSDSKNVIVIEGGPGTGKSVIAINLLAKLTSLGKVCQYVSRNTAPRAVYSYNLKGTMKKTSIDNLFKSSGSYTNIDNDVFDMLIVDEAHCLTEKSGLFSNYGINQIKEIINASKCSVFFIDELQKVHLNDIGTIKEIELWAKYYGASIFKYKLNSQFRCCGSNNYLDFIDFVLGYRNNFDGDIGYDIKVIDSPIELDCLIKQKNKTSSSRLLAGYCWNWNKKEVNNPDCHDIVIGDYSASWNLGMNQTFAIDDSINEVGCIHSVQGLEFDYVGVIIGQDLCYNDNKICTDVTKHASTDPSFKGIKKMLKEDKSEAFKIADEIIRNTYRVLLTRGKKGCYIYCVDKELNQYLKNTINLYSIDK